MTQARKRRYHSQLKLIFIGSVVAISIVVVDKFNLQELLRTLLLWVDSLDSGGAIAYIVIYNLATVLFVPGVFLTLGGGVLFGLVWGSVYVLIAAILGATWAFLIGRYLCRGLIWQKIQQNAQFQAIALAVRQQGWKIVLLTRLSPILPFNLLNYAYGVLKLPFRDYILGSLGILPGTVMYVYLGSLVGDLARIGMSEQSISPETQVVQWLIRIVGLLATIILTIYLTRVARQALNQSISSAR